MKKAKLCEDNNGKSIFDVKSVNSTQQWIKDFNEDLQNPSLNISDPSQCNINNTKLQKVLFDYLTKTSPLLLNLLDVSGVMKFVVDEFKFERLLRIPLEEFLCSGVCPSGFDDLKSYGKPSKFCGKIFNVGDLTFSCKDCGTDPTCVLCNDCFYKSEHRNHKHTIHASSGNGGYCDCGDIEAWSTHPACESHKESLEVDNDWDPLSALPTEIQHRATFLLSFLVQYSVNLICWEKCDVLPEPLQIISTDEKSHIVMLFNDESHTYDEVINTLTTAIKCTKKEASHFASIVDKEGRSAIYTNKSTDCLKVVSICRDCTSKNGKKALKCEAIHKDIVAHQLVALKLMSWLSNTVDQSDGFRRLLAILVTQKIAGRSESILKQIIYKDAELWKVVRGHTHKLFMNAILMDMYGRLEFAKIFAECYRMIMKGFIEDDHEHSVSVASLSVQIFTVPTLAEILTLEYNILKTCFETYWSVLEVSVTNNGSLDFQDGNKGPDLKRADYILNDLRYLLRHKPTWNEVLRARFLDSFDVFLKILVAMQGMDSMQRKTITHIIYEPQWDSGFNLQLWIMPVFESLMSWCCTDIDVYHAVFTKCITALRTLPEQLTFKRDTTGTLHVDHSVTTNLVSMHAALSRFIAGLIPGVAKFSLILSETLQLQFYSDDLVQNQLRLLEYPIRCLVLVAQVNAKMWRRNGYSIMHNVFYYQNVRFASEMFDRDLLLIQAVAAIMDPSVFIDVLMTKYDLVEWDSETSRSKNKETAKTTEIMAEGFFLLLFYILSERYVVGLSEVTSREILKREVMHRLALGPTSRSLLVRTLPSKDPDDEGDCNFESSLDDVLKEIATYRQPGLSGKGVYELKRDYFSQCNQFFLHFSKAERSKMLEKRKNVLKKDALETIEYLPLPPKFHPQFEGVLNLLTSCRMEKLLKVVLQKSLEETIDIDELTEEALLIIATGLLEQKRYRAVNHLTDFKFTETILNKSSETDKSIMNLIDDLNLKSKSYSAMLRWLKKLAQSEIEKTGVCEMEVDGAPDQREKDNAERKRKLRFAKERQEKMMAQMKGLQQAFMKTHNVSANADEDMDKVVCEISVLTDNTLSKAIGVHRTAAEISDATGQCILCHQEEESIDTGAFVVTCFHSNVKYLQPSCIKDGKIISPVLNHAAKVNISSCGHILHSHCWEKYYAAVNERESSLLLQYRRRSCIDRGCDEYLCPLCKSLCNTVLPLLPRVEQEECLDTQDMSVTEFLAYLERFAAESSQHVVSTNFASKNQQTVSSRLKKVWRTYMGNDVPSPAEKFIALFSKKLLEISNPESNGSCCDLALSWVTFSFTIQAFECSYRALGKNMFNNLSERQRMFWHAMIQYLSTTCQNATPTSSLHNYAAIVFNFFSSTDTTQELCILDADILGIMISLRFIVSIIQNTFQEPNFIKLSSCLADDGLFKLCLIAYLVKLYMIAPVFEEDDENEDEELEESTLEAWQYIMSLCLPSTVCLTNNNSMLKSYILKSLLPFFRCTAFFFHFLTGIKLPAVLREEIVVDELQVLLEYLNLPKDANVIISKSWLTQESAVVNVIKKWCKHKDIARKIENRLVENVCVEARRLISLPLAYSSLIHKASGFRCPTVGDCSRSPALCLLCNTLLCNQCYCCMAQREVGACALHSMQCANGVGVFLRIRESEIIVMYNQKKGAILQSPYLDEYGEPDKGFRRGNPLFLNESRYEQLKQLWLQQRIPETIAQSMETNRGFLAFDWQQQ